MIDLPFILRPLKGHCVSRNWCTCIPSLCLHFTANWSMLIAGVCQWWWCINGSDDCTSSCGNFV